MALKPISVTQLNEYLYRLLITDPLLGNLCIKGEIVGIKYHSNGNIYFSLMDEKSRINCVIYANYAVNVDFELKDGMKIVAYGSVNVYKAGGSYSLIIKNVEIEGVGSLQAQFEKLKQKLNAEGLFDVKYKKQIPSFPKKIGIVTSGVGAAYRDIMKNIKDRNDYVSVVLFSVLVQGPNAADEISEAIRLANSEFDDIDVLIVGRGGGSQEDIWPFNEEIVARSIFESKIPVITGIGHEIDFTISDMVSDMRAETPTKAAILACPDTTELAAEAEKLLADMRNEFNNKLQFNSIICENLLRSAKDALTSRIDTFKHKIEQMKLTLEYNNPNKILSLGYSVLSETDGKVISDSKDLSVGKEYNIKLHHGNATCVISNKGEN